MNTKLVTTVVDQLKNWKNIYLTDFNIEEAKAMGRTEITDDLNGIHHDKHTCFASYLFKQLSKVEKTAVLNQVDFHVDFDRCETIYYL